jgi:hypothetical protein
MMMHLRSCLSAQAPPAKEIRNWGRYEQIVNAATHLPLDVCLVTNQMMTICTTVEPKSVMD